MKRLLNFRPSRFVSCLFLPTLLFGLPIVSQASDLAALLKQPSNSSSQNGFLPPDQAFKLTVQARNSQQIIASFTPAPGYYLYRDRIRFNLKRAGGMRIIRTRMPTAETKVDPYFGRMAVYPHPFQVVIDLKRADTARGAIALSANYQGCSERGLCYQPITKVIPVTLPAGPQKAR